MKFKTLVWESNRDHTHFYVKAPARVPKYKKDVVIQEMSITFEDGKFWPNWDMNLPGFLTLLAAQNAGQMAHEAYLRQFIDESVDV